MRVLQYEWWLWIPADYWYFYQFYQLILWETDLEMLLIQKSRIRHIKQNNRLSMLGIFNMP